MANLEEPEKGLEQRYMVQHLGNPDKHRDCEYFVLDLTHDPLARRAAGLYAAEARMVGHEKLADDLDARVNQIEAFFHAEDELKKLREKRNLNAPNTDPS